jgi:serine/threonine-protein kinase
LNGDHAKARAAFELSLVLLDSVFKSLPDDWRARVARGLTLAGLGRRDEALEEARWLQQSEVYRSDFYIGSWLGQARAQIFAQAGDTEGAIDEIKRLFEGPSWLTVYALRLDPLWDPLRNDPRFQALVAKAE